MNQVNKEAWHHHVFLIDKANMNEKLAECEANFDNQRDRQNCFAHVGKYRSKR